MRKKNISKEEIEVINSPKHMLLYKIGCRLGIKGYDLQQAYDYVVDKYRAGGINLPSDDLKNLQNGLRRGYERHVEESGYKARGYSIIRRQPTKKTSKEVQDDLEKQIDELLNDENTKPLRQEEFLDICKEQITAYRKYIKDGVEHGGYMTDGTRINKHGQTVKKNKYFTLNNKILSNPISEHGEYHCDMMGLPVVCIDIDKETEFSKKIMEKIEKWQKRFWDYNQYTMNPKKPDKFSYHFLFGTDKKRIRKTQGIHQDIGVDFLGNEDKMQSINRELSRREWVYNVLFPNEL